MNTTFVRYYNEDEQNLGQLDVVEHIKKVFENAFGPTSIPMELSYFEHGCVQYVNVNYDGVVYSYAQ